jgi:hypothetical protein
MHCDRGHRITQVRLNERFKNNSMVGEPAPAAKQFRFAADAEHNQCLMVACPRLHLRIVSVFEHELRQRVGGLDDRLRR